MTYTYAVLDVEGSTYRDIARRLIKADYGHAFHEDDGRQIIDMHGIAIADGGAPTATISCACGGVFKVDLPEPHNVDAEQSVMGQAYHPDIEALRCPYDTLECGQKVQLFGVVSSHLRDVGYLHVVNVLRVRLWGGTVGQYANVTEAWWQDFQQAASKGRAMMALRTEKTPWTRLR